MGAPKPVDPKEAVAKLAKATAKDYNLPVPNVAQIFMKHKIDEKGISDALKECGELRFKLTKAALKKNRLW
jgi:hypothetical protein